MTLIFNDKLMQDLALPSLANVGNSSISSNMGVSIYFPLISKYYFYLKVGFILFLFILNIYLLFHSDESLIASFPNQGQREEYQQSTISNLNRILKEYSGIFVVVGSVYTAQLNFRTALSQEEREKEIIKADKCMERCEKLQIEEKGILDNLGEIVKKITGANMRFQQIKKNAEESVTDSKAALDHINAIKAILNKFNNTEDEFEKSLLQVKLQEHGLALDKVSTTICNNITKNEDLLKEVSKYIDTPSSNPEQESLDPSPQPKAGEDLTKSTEGKDAIIKDEDIKKSSFFNIDNFEDWFNNLSAIKQLSFSLLVSQGIVLSALTNIIFIHYGNYIISKFNLEQRFPKLKIIIEYRNKFSKFYFINSCFVIVIISLIYISFAISMLSL